jgi:membrane fusion protein, copper/silver efflux system
VTRIIRSMLIPAAVIAAGVGGYGVGRHAPDLSSMTAATAGRADAPNPNPSGPVIYYQDPDGKPAYSAGPKSTPDGRSYRTIHASEDVSYDKVEAPETAEAQPGKPAGNRKVLYYRNPMGLPDVSKAPKKDSMGMDYIPVYEGEDDDGATVRLSPGKVQRAGVRSEPAAMRVIAEPVRAPGTIQFDERRVAVISLRAEAYIEAVENVTTGSEVHKGDPLVRLFSQTIANAAAEFLTSGLPIRLLNLGVPEQFIAEVKHKHEVPLTFAWLAPRDGFVLERNVVDGQRVAPGDVLFRIADHSTVWAMVDVAERDLAAVAEGQPVTVRVRSYPDRTFAGKVALVYPHLNPATRTVPVRIELANTQSLLKPSMYAEAEIDTGGGAPVLAVPDAAVIDSGDRKVIIVDKGNGRFEPRAVRLGRRGAGYVEVRNGVTGGEAVVTTANFLIDAESNLKSALQSLSATGAAP